MNKMEYSSAGSGGRGAAEAEADAEAQSDEMTALESILEPNTFTFTQKEPNDLISGSIKISMDLPDPFWIVPSNSPSGTGTGDSSPSSSSSRLSVNYLPPLSLHFTLPINYPSVSKPVFVLSSTWLHRKPLSKLCKKLDHLWKTEAKGSAVLFTWYSFLRYDALGFLGIKDTLTIKDSDLRSQSHHHHANHKLTKKPGTGASSNASTPSGTGVAKTISKNKKHGQGEDARAVFEPIATTVSDGLTASMIPYLVQFNIDESYRIFNASIHRCPICFTERFGKDSIKFTSGCGHVFCKDCVGEYFKGLITEGSVDSLKCLEHGCDYIPGPNIVKMCVSSELYERYDRLLLSRSLDQMSDILYCPISSCHSPVLCELDDKLAKCPKCCYVFCSSCKKGYHGVEPCRFKDAEKKAVYDSYASGTEAEKKQLEKTYGKRQLESLVHTVLSEKWITSQSRPCPHCTVPIEKFAGCNKVTCFKCNTYFCWICLVQLDHGNPYKHFNDPQSKCYNNLFYDPNQPERDPDDDPNDPENQLVYEGFDEDDDDDWDDEDWDPLDEDYSDIESD